MFSLLAIIFQVGGFIAEMSRCGRYSWKLACNRVFTNLFGLYGSDIMLSVLKYKNEKLDTADSQGGVLWKAMAAVMYYLNKIFAWVVFCDPYSGIFQTRYKTNCIHLSEGPSKGEGYDELWKSASKKLQEYDAEAGTIGARPDQLVGSEDDVKPEVLVKTVKVRSVNFMLRYSKVGLQIGGLYHPNEYPEAEEECVVQVLLYTSQGNNSGGLFHELYGPLQTTRSQVIELLVLMELLSNDAFVVENKPPDTEETLTCLSFRETMKKILSENLRVNFAMRTGMSFC